MKLLKRVHQYIEQHGLLAQDQRVLLGVSGGPDSLALLHILNALSADLEFDLHVLHVEHGLRGAEAEADAQFVMAQSAHWDIPATLRRADVPAIAARLKLGIEEAARQARYTHFAEVALEIGASHVAVGHNADDQSETVLMHFLRGSGLAGLRGMRPHSALSNYHLLRPLDAQLTLIRPLLATPRADIETYCAEHNLQPRFDRSNLDSTYFRNRLRHDVLPMLEQLNPGLRETLRRTAAIVAAEHEIIEQQAQIAWDACLVSEKGDALQFDLRRWRDLPLALQRATIRKAVWRLRRSLRDVTFVHVEDSLHVALQGNTGSQASLPAGLTLRVGYDYLSIEELGRPVERPSWPLLAAGEMLEIDVSGNASTDNGWQLTLSTYSGPREGSQWEGLLADRWAVPLDGDALGHKCTVRARRPGDRFQPPNVGGSQKVADFMINARIPAQLRGQLPLLVTAKSQIIVWLVGWRVDERFIVRPSTRNVIVARFERTD